MANTLRFKRGLVAGIPTAALGEPLFTTDTFDLYIGNGTTNTRFQKYIASGTTSQLLRGDGSLLTMPIVLTSPANGQVLKYNGTSWVNDSDAGITGSGTTNYLPKFTSATTLGNSRIFDNGTNVGIGLITPDVELAVYSASVSRFHLQNLSSGVSATDGLQFAISGSDGYIWNWENGGLFFATNNTQRARITSGGNFIINNASTDNGLRFQVTGDGYFSGSVGIGATALTGFNLRIGKNIEGAVTSYGAAIVSTVQSGVTNSARIFYSEIGTQAASFTLPDINHFFAVQGTFGAGSTVTNQYGYRVFNNLTGATTNYGFYGDIASGTGRWNLYMNGTAANYLAGTLSIGTTANDAGYLRNYATIPVLALQNPTTGTAVGDGFQLSVSGSLAYIWQYENAAMLFGTNATERMRLDASGNLGLGTASPQSGTGFTFMSINGSSYGALSLQNAGSHRFSLYNDGSNTLLISIPNNGMVFGTNGAERMRVTNDGNVLIGTTTNAGFKLDVNGTMRVSGASGASPDVTINNTASGSWLRMIGAGTPTNIIDSNGILLIRNGSTYTTKLTLDTSGNLGLGTTSPTVITGYTTLAVNNATNGGNIDLMTAGTRHASWNNTATETYFGTRSNTPLAFTTNATEVARFYANGNFRIGGNAADAGFRLDVNGTMRVSGNATFGTNTLFVDNGSTRVGIGNTAPVSKLDITGSLGSVRVLDSGAELYFTRNGNNDFYANSGSSCAISIGAQNHVRFLTGTTLTERMRLDASGNLLLGSTSSSGELLQVTGTAKISGEFRVAAAINSTQATFANTTGRGLAISTAVVGGTNEAAVVLNARSSVTSGTFIFQTDGTQRVQIDSTGLIINGGNALEFINSAANAVSAIRPTSGGTSVMSTNSNGLHIAVGTEAAGDLILASNNTERVRLSSNGWFSHTSATNPSSSVTDSYVQYSADVTAGNAAPHFRTENGAVIKIYQETTSVGNSIFSQGGGNSVLDDSTFDGYTLRQIVKALRNQGILQ